MPMLLMNTLTQVYVREGILVKFSVSVLISTWNGGESSEYIEWIGNIHNI